MPPGEINILLVEDNPTDANITVEKLARVEDFPHHITHSASLMEALNNLKGKFFNVCLLDLELPDSRGTETITNLVEAAPDLPMVVVTNSKDKANAVAAFRAGAQDYLIKAELGPHQMATALVMAMARHKFLKGELTSLAGFPFETKASTTMQLYGQGPLQLTNSLEQKQLIDIYSRAVEEAVDLSPYGEKPKIKLS